MATTTDEPRASPDALLALAAREGRGRLRIFFGAAPGVGKTYAMLQAARAAREAGVDAVVGLVETHGRKETEALLDGVELLPRLSLPHRGRMVAEFDLDAALARRPGLLLVDEYAHTNAPGSRHPKRWQDIAELLAAGIDVWTTLNVQHLESLNDVVQRITRVRVRETVPDAAFDAADEIVLVDLPADELLKRLAEGKVYLAETAARAVENFFRTDNLVALRELALRRAAERIDSDLLERMRLGAIEGPWAAGERILVCVGPDEMSPRVVRQAKRLADQIGAPLLAVTVEHPDERLSAAERRRAEEALRLAESLGADTRTLVGPDLVRELLRFARSENVTQIVVGRSRGGRIAELLGRSLTDQLVRAAEDIAIHVVTAPAGRRPSLFARLGARLQSRTGAPAFLLSAAAVGAAVLAGRALVMLVPLPNISMVFLLAVLFSAVNFGFWPAAAASLLSFLSYNFFFIDPLYTFTIARPHELLALLVFLGVAMLTSALAGKVRRQAQDAAARARATGRLYDFTRRISGLAEAGAVADGAAVELHGDLGRAALILLPETGGTLTIAAAWPPEDELDTASQSAAQWAFQKQEPAGADTGTLPNVPWYFLPLKAGTRSIGAVGVATGNGVAPLDRDDRTIVETVAGLTAAALDRARLAREIGEAKAATEAERIRNTLLASISHDFRTPLASILGAATSLIDYGPKLPDAARSDLLHQVKDEAEHLDGMVRNLLSMTRLEAGALELRRDWIDVGEMLHRAVALARRYGAAQELTVTTPTGLPYLFADQTLLDQAIGNIVGNAVKYSGPDARVHLTAEAEADGGLRIEVVDTGPGIAREWLPRIFDKFARAPAPAVTGDGGEGTGLGLAIAKGIVAAHGGTIAAESPVEAGGGTRIVLRFPAGRRAAS
jgi:two-component system sensor histidine kinase KdpD